MQNSFHHETFLVFSMLGNISLNIADYLVSKGKSVRLAVTNADSLKTKLEDQINRYESIHEFSPNAALNKSIFNNDLKRNHKVRFIYVVLNESSTSPSLYLQLMTNLITLLNQLGISKQIEKLVLVSSSGVIRPFSTKTLFLNIFSGYRMYNLLQAENILRRSGISYLIVRPTELHLGQKATNFRLDQGDRLKGFITPRTVSQIAVDTSFDPWIFANTTFECTSQGSQLGEEYKYVVSQYAAFKPDNKIEEIEKRVDSHKSAVRTVSFLVLISSVILGYLIKLRINRKTGPIVNLFF